MKKEAKSKPKNRMRLEYDFRNGTRGKHAAQYACRTTSINESLPAGPKLVVHGKSPFKKPL